MLKSTWVLLFLIVLLTGCAKDEVITRTVYVDRIEVEYPPSNLLVIPEEPKLNEGVITNQDLVEWAVDLRTAYREVVENIKSIEEWKKALSE